MAKLILYLALTAVGIVATLLSPFAGAIATLEAYLLNPSAIVGDYFDFRYQLWITLSFIVSYLLYRPAKLPAVGREGRSLTFLWIFVAIGALSATWAVVSSKEALDAIFEVFKTVRLLLIRKRRHQDRKTDLLADQRMPNRIAPRVYCADVRRSLRLRTYSLWSRIRSFAGHSSSHRHTICTHSVHYSNDGGIAVGEAAFVASIIPFALNSLVSTYDTILSFPSRPS